MKAFRNIIVFCWRVQKKFFLKFRNVKLDSGVGFNPSTNIGNNCRIGKNCDIHNSIIGSYTYIGPGTNIANSKIGSFCSIASDVKIVTSCHPSDTFVSTSPVFYSTLKQCGITFVKKDLYQEHRTINGYSALIMDDVWIGNNVILMGGITIGTGAIIGSGAVVTKNVPPYAIVGGVPAKIIRYRFTDSQIQALLSDKWWEKSEKWSRENIDKMCNINEYINHIQYKL